MAEEEFFDRLKKALSWTNITEEGLSDIGMPESEELQAKLLEVLEVVSANFVEAQDRDSES